MSGIQNKIVKSLSFAQTAHFTAHMTVSEKMFLVHKIAYNFFVGEKSL